MATVVEAWRVICDRTVLAAAAEEAALIERTISEADDSAHRIWREFGEDMPDLEDSYTPLRHALQDAESALHDAAVRLRHLAA